MQTDSRASLAAAIADLAVLRGEFVLRSGQTSRYYIDKYRFSTRPEVLRPIGVMLAERAAAHRPRRLAGAELGGIPLVTAAGLESGLPTILVRNAKKDYGTSKRIEGVLEAGDRVVFVEDVTTTGGQTIEAIRALRDLGAEVAAAIVTVDREQGAQGAIEAEGVAFEALFTKSDLGIED